jgi:hypothetical protein
VELTRLRRELRGYPDSSDEGNLQSLLDAVDVFYEHLDVLEDDLKRGSFMATMPIDRVIVEESIALVARIAWLQGIGPQVILQSLIEQVGVEQVEIVLSVWKQNYQESDELAESDEHPL